MIPRPFPDHHPFRAIDLAFGDDLAVLMTEKDAVKCRTFARPDHWFVPVDAEPGPVFGRRLLQLLETVRPAAEGAAVSTHHRNPRDG